jgi:hypothetical protein
MNENQNTTNVPDVKTETAENNSTLFLSKPSVHYGVISENITTPTFMISSDKLLTVVHAQY